MSSPLVTIICLCYNHERFVLETLKSVVNQSYSSIQLIVVDDASTDDSKKIIDNFFKEHPGVEFVSLQTNHGICAAFNIGLKKAKGEFVIDLAADDILLPSRVENGVREFLLRGSEWGVQFTDAEIIDESGRQVGLHSTRVSHDTVPQGDVYEDLIRRYFICSPTMLVRRSVYDRLGGYDETLAFEDFDFWIRSSREFRYFYSREISVRRRIVKGSMSEKQFTRGNAQRKSTYDVCRKIMRLNRSRSEQEALSERIWYEVRQCLRLFDFGMAWEFVALARENSRIIFR